MDSLKKISNMSQKRESHYEKKKKGKHLLSHRYNLLPLLRSRPGGVQKELIVKDLPGTNVVKDIYLQRGKSYFFSFFGHYDHNLLTLNRLKNEKKYYIYNFRKQFYGQKKVYFLYKFILNSVIMNIVNEIDVYC